ncbi:MAG: carboxypeptidase-like regulatory domain-containing protein [Flavobacteriaceae bacterium]|nr:carboxypeptidase-like regulatory domain-containing protein [Flavobacteriaceae bacterium]
MKRTITLLAILFSMTATAQFDGQISGKVLDLEMNGEPLLFATVSLANTTYRTQTNLHGNFEFTDLKPGSYVLQFSFLGYESQEIEIEVKSGGQTEVLSEMHALRRSSPGLSLTAVEQIPSDAKAENQK